MTPIFGDMLVSYILFIVFTVTRFICLVEKVRQFSCLNFITNKITIENQHYQNHNNRAEAD